ncbi:MAG TPA: TrmB family transcriptional regulator [Candidatus Bathyarchaeota archaeon]|nr:TrmB family transcriptional regulator [Candidatus Bathyarchaeota archaeon]
MEVGEQVVSSLMKLGLTRYEALAYIALVQLGSGTVADIHRLSGVPTTKLYEVLSRLEAKGWVEVLRERPLKYRARPPDETVGPALKELVRSVEDAKSILSEIYERRLEIERSDVWMVRGKANVESKMVSMVKGASQSITLALSKFALDLLGQVKDVLMDAYWRGLDVKVLLSGVEEAPDLGPIDVVMLTPAQINAEVTIIYSMVVIDMSELLLALPIGITRGGMRDVVGVWVRDRSLARLADQYVSLMMKVARGLSS